MISIIIRISVSPKMKELYVSVMYSDNSGMIGPPAEPQSCLVSCVLLVYCWILKPQFLLNQVLSKKC